MVWASRPGASVSSQSLTGRCRTLFAGKSGLERAKELVVDYKQGRAKEMTPELWKAKKLVDATLHPGMRRLTHALTIHKLTFL